MTAPLPQSGPLAMMLLMPFTFSPQASRAILSHALMPFCDALITARTARSLGNSGKGWAAGKSAVWGREVLVSVRYETGAMACADGCQSRGGIIAKVQVLSAIMEGMALACHAIKKVYLHYLFDKLTTHTARRPIFWRSLLVPLYRSFFARSRCTAPSPYLLRTPHLSRRVGAASPHANVMAHPIIRTAGPSDS